MKWKQHSDNPDLAKNAVDVIGATPYFQSLKKSLLVEIFTSALTLEAEKGETIINQGDDNDYMVYILLEGGVDLFRDDNFILKMNQVGQIFGEMAAISSDPRSADVRSNRATKAVVINSGFLHEKNAESIQAAYSFMVMFTRVLSEKLHTTTERAKLYEDVVLENKEIEEYSLELKREIQQKLQQIKLYSQVVESNQDAIIVSDLNGKIQFCNHAALSLFGLESDQVAQIYVKSLFNRLLEESAEFESTFIKGWKGERAALSSDGKSFPASLSVSAIRSAKEDSKTISFAVEVRDITKEKEYENNILKKNTELQQTYQELEKSVNDLKKSNRVKSAFLSNISSQLKTPLISISNHSDLLRKHLQKKEKTFSLEDFLNNIEGEKRKLNKMVWNLLTMAELNVNLGNLIPKIVRLIDLIKLIRKFEYFKEIKIEFNSDLAESTVFVDKYKLEQAFSELDEYLVVNIHANKFKKVEFIQNEQTRSLEILFIFNDPKTEQKVKKLSEGIELRIQKIDLNLALGKRIMELHEGDLIYCRDKYEVIKFRLPLDLNKGIIRKFKIAIVDEREYDRMILRGVSERILDNLEIFEFETQIDSVNAMNALNPDLIIVDPEFSEPNWDYDVFLRKLNSGRRDSSAVLAISKLWNDDSYRNSFLELGITDFLPKPFTVWEIEFKINTIVNLRQQLSLLSSNVEKAEKSAVTDGLTSLFNRKYYDKFIKEQLMKSEIQGGKCSVIMSDVDNFKIYNDTNGHQLGDEVLKLVSSILKDNVRESDMVARYGGEEFIVVLPGTGKKMALLLAEKLRATIEETEFLNEDTQPLGKITTSFGVSTFPENGNTPEILLKGADHCLYVAKEKGRNQVIGAEGVIKL